MVIFCAASILGFTYAGKFVDDGQKFACTCMDFYFDLVEGEQGEEKPLWAGLNELSNVIDESIASVDRIIVKSENFSNSSGISQSSIDNYRSSLTSYFANLGNRTLNTANPEVTAAVTPAYISILGPYTSENTSLWVIEKEFDNTVVFGKKAIDAIKSNTNELKTQSESIKNALFEIKTQLDEINSQTNEINSKVVEPVYDYQQRTDETGALALYILFGSLLALMLTNYIIILFYGFIFKIQCLRYFSNCIWIVLSILTWILLLFAFVFGGLYVMSQDGNYLIDYIFGTDNLSKEIPVVVEEKEIASILDECINKEGNLYETYFKDEVDQISSFSEIFEYQKTIRDLENRLKESGKSAAIALLTSQLTNLKTHLRSTTDTSNSSNSLATVMNEWQKYSDVEHTGSYISSCASVKVSEIYGGGQNECPAGYPFSTSDSAANASPKCLNLNDFTETSIESRYSVVFNSCVSTGGKYNNAIEANKKYLLAVQEYSNNNEILLEEMIVRNDQLDTQYSSIINSASQDINTAASIIQEFVDLIGKFLPDDSDNFFDIIRCDFIGENLREFKTAFAGDFGDSTLLFTIFIGIIGISSSLIIFMQVIIILRYRVKDA